MKPTFWVQIMIGLTLCLLIGSVQAGTFRDDFEDGDLDGWRQEFPFAQAPTLWRIVDGELECTRPNPASTLLIIGEPNWRDYTIEYDVKLLVDLGPAAVSVISRYKSPAWTHIMDVFIGDWLGVPAASTQRFPGGVFGPRSLVDPLELNQWRHLKLEVKSRNFTLWFNGEKVLEHQDDAVKEGAVGIGVANYTARFDNVEISGPDVPDVTPPTWKGLPVQP